MKTKSEGPALEFNPPAVILVRLVFLLMVLILLAAGALLVAGGITHETWRIILGAAVAVFAGGIYGWLRRRGRLADVFSSSDIFEGPDRPEEDFARLVHAWEDLRVKRGTAEFDAWEWLRLRREIEARAKDDPRLTDYWRDHQA